MNIKNAPITSTGFLLASAGVAVGTIAGTLLRPTVEKVLRRKPKRNTFEEAMQNPTVVENVPGSPIDETIKKHTTEN